MSELELLQLVLLATQQQKLNWKQVEKESRYFADVERYLYSIEYQNPALTNGKEAEGSLISVTIAGVLITCAEGTPHAELVEQILAAAFQDWAETARFMEEARVEAAERLVNLINGSAADAERLFAVPPLSDWVDAVKRFSTKEQE